MNRQKNTLRYMHVDGKLQKVCEYCRKPGAYSISLFSSSTFLTCNAHLKCLPIAKMNTRKGKIPPLIIPAICDLCNTPMLSERNAFSLMIHMDSLPTYAQYRYKVSKTLHRQCLRILMNLQDSDVLLHLMAE